MEIDKASKEALILELMSRSKFRGVIVWQAEDFDEGDDPNKPTSFRWQSHNCNVGMTLQGILDAIR